MACSTAASVISGLGISAGLLESIALPVGKLASSGISTLTPADFGLFPGEPLHVEGRIPGDVSRRAGGTPGTPGGLRPPLPAVAGRPVGSPDPDHRRPHGDLPRGPPRGGRTPRRPGRRSGGAEVGRARGAPRGAWAGSGARQGPDHRGGIPRGDPGHHSRRRRRRLFRGPGRRPSPVHRAAGVGAGPGPALSLQPFLPDPGAPERGRPGLRLRRRPHPPAAGPLGVLGDLARGPGRRRRRRLGRRRPDRKPPDVRFTLTFRERALSPNGAGQSRKTSEEETAMPWTRSAFAVAIFAWGGTLAADEEQVKWMRLDEARARSAASGKPVLVICMTDLVSEGPGTKG